MKQSTYSILDGQETLIQEKFFDDQNNLIRTLDYSMRPHEETRYTYDDRNQLILEESIVEGRVGDSQEFVYDADGKVIERRHNINGDLYEKMTIEDVDGIEKRTTVQDGEETQRIEVKENGNVKTFHVFQYGELVQFNTVTTEENKVTVRAEMPGTDQIYTEVEVLNENGDVIERAEYVGEDNKVSSLQQQFDGKNRVKTTFESSNQPHTNYEEVYTYDEKGNQTGYEKTDSGGRLLAFEKVRYNELNKIIEVAGNSGSGKYHQRIDYDDSL
jgi:hypothetical protein